MLSWFPTLRAEHRSPKNGAPDFCGATYIAKYRGECEGGLRRSRVGCVILLDRARSGSGAKDLSPCGSGFPPFGLNTAARRMGHPIFVALLTLPGTELSLDQHFVVLLTLPGTELSLDQLFVVILTLPGTEVRV